MSSGMAWRGAGLWGAFDLDGFAAEEFLFGLGGVAVDADLAGFDEELDAGAGDVGNGLGEVLVEAEVGGGGVGGEGADVRGARSLRSQRLRIRGRGLGGGVGLFDAAGGAVLGLTVWRRWPLGSMFLDGMRDRLSGLEVEGQMRPAMRIMARADPLDGVEEVRGRVGVGVGWRKKVRRNWVMPEAARARAMVSPGWWRLGELAEKDEGEEDGCDGGVEGYGVEAGSSGGRDGMAPGEGGGEAGVAAFGEVAEGEEGPDEGGAGSPGVEGGEEGEMLRSRR